MIATRFLLVACSIKIVSGIAIPNGFDYSAEEFGKTYYGSSTVYTFQEAHALCKSVGGEILKIRNAQEQDFFKAHRRELWLDASNRHSWNDGTRMEYSAWGFFSDVRGCTLFMYTDGLWYCRAYADRAAVMCEVHIRATTAPPIVSSTDSDVQSLLSKVNSSGSVNERIASLERRIEQISNAVMNRGVANNDNNNVTALSESVNEILVKQGEMENAIKDMRSLMQAVVKSLHGE